MWWATCEHIERSGPSRVRQWKADAAAFPTVAKERRLDVFDQSGFEA
jgi:hypothetical protein